MKKRKEQKKEAENGKTEKIKDRKTQKKPTWKILPKKKKPQLGQAHAKKRAGGGY
jgi:hypothetical protein